MRGSHKKKKAYCEKAKSPFLVVVNGSLLFHTNLCSCEEAKHRKNKSKIYILYIARYIHTKNLRHFFIYTHLSLYLSTIYSYIYRCTHARTISNARGGGKKREEEGEEEGGMGG